MKAAFAVLVGVLLTAQVSAQLSYERIRQADREPGHWLTYHGTYDGKRFSTLDEINTTNVQRLRPVWMYQVQGRHHFEATPLVFDGVMYLSDPPSDVVALDVKTGRPIWTYRRTLPDDVRACCGQVNRGVAALGDQIFINTIDAHLVALDMRTGRVRWDIEVADYTIGHSMTWGAAGRQGQDHRRHRRRGVRRPRLSRRLRCQHREAGLASVDRAGAGGTRLRDLVG